MKSLKIFIVEDDPWYGEMIKYHLSLNPDYEVYLYSNARDCLKDIYLNPDVICIDYYLPDTTGEELLKKIKSLRPDIPVIVLSGQEDISVALGLLKNGVYDYIIKDDNAKELLWNLLSHIGENHHLKEEVKELKKQLGIKYDFENSIIGQSKTIKKQFELIKDAAETNINVSISGETGTGKEIVAKAIHYNSDRKNKPFVAINMASIPRELIESDLFGHEKGAFTGAVAMKKGKFEDANGGTIFLDEIAELDLNIQVKLLRVLQEREVVRVGGNARIKFNTRLITATNKNLSTEVKKGTFRKDLYYRIIGLHIEMPPLRERAKDTLLLAQHFVEVFSKENNLKTPVLTAEAKEKLMKYSYPGNVRELKSVIDLACVMSKNNDYSITADNIVFHVDIVNDEVFTVMEKTLREYNADIISYFLNKYNNNIVEVAEKLAIGKSTIYNMIKSGEVKNK